MDKRVAVTVLVAATLAQVSCGSFGWKKVRNVQVLGFDWKNCGPPDAPAVLKTLTMSPDPISIPGDLTASASGSTVVELGAPLSGSYTLPQSIFYLPNIDLPYWLTNGDYRVQGVLGSQGKELGCLKVTLSIHSD
ncbi:ganglioside GM2 activator [Neolamprologus brichardi]|uniref:ganglioside GM2 activator n=1 Tax=Neolamprologus brichardi TaxID=32507 RepID=UPI0003EC6733|nr:ganglioside GM2 activator [Neolamprologus brichardi]